MRSRPDVMEFRCSKTNAQRILKDCRGQRILFRSPKRTNPQRFYPSVLRAQILENLKQKGNTNTHQYQYTSRRSSLLTRPFRPLKNRKHKTFTIYFIRLVDILFTSTSYSYNFHLNQDIILIFKRPVRNITNQSSTKRKLVRQLSSI